MISNSIFEFVTSLISKVVTFAGLSDFTVSEEITTAFAVVKLAFAQGVPMVSWLFPTDSLYQFCVGLTIDLFTATLIFETIGTP